MTAKKITLDGDAVEPSDGPVSSADGPPAALGQYDLPRDVKAGSALLSASVNPNGSADAWFVYKRDGDEDYSASSVVRITGGEQFVTAPVEGLEPGCRYTYVVALRNEHGTGGGGLFQEFTTAEK